MAVKSWKIRGGQPCEGLGESTSGREITVAKMDSSSESLTNGKEASMATTAGQERETVGDVISDLCRGHLCRIRFEFEF